MFFFSNYFSGRLNSLLNVSHKLRNSHFVTFAIDTYYPELNIYIYTPCNAQPAKTYGAIISPWIMNLEKAENTSSALSVSVDFMQNTWRNICVIT